MLAHSHHRFNYHSTKALRTTSAGLPRSALPCESITSVLNVGLVRSMQSEVTSATANDMKDCISQSVNEVEATFVLSIRGQGNSKIYEEYRLTSEIPDKSTLNVLQEKFITKMNSRGFIWRAVKLIDSFELLAQLYLRVLIIFNIY